MLKILSVFAVKLEWLLIGLLFNKRKYGNIGTLLAFLLEFHDTINQREEGMIFSNPHIQPGIVNSSPLADNDVAGFGCLPAIYLNT